MSEITSAPEGVTGGCLCGAVRYTIKFPEGSEWPPKNGTCQCTMCRKWTASLVPHSLTIPTKHIEPELSSWPSLKQYRSSSTATRSFCDKCGSCLTFNSDEEPEDTEIWIGTLDEEVLVGRKVLGSEKTLEHGIRFAREGGLGATITAKPDVNIWMQNAIPGLTDQLRGPKYLQDRTEGKGVE